MQYMAGTTKQKEIGKRIREGRHRMDMTQGQLAKRIGITAAQLSYWEKGERSIGIESLILLSNALHMSLDELVYGTDNAAEEKNLNLYLSLSRCYQPKEVANALSIARSYLEIVEK